MTSLPAGANRFLRSNLLPGAVLALCIARLWLMALPSSFWVDEMATVFVVQQGAHHPSFAAAPQVPDSLYYLLPRISSALFGQSEIAYRIPSLLAAGLTLLLMAKLAARLIHPQAGWFAVFGLMAVRDFNDHAVDARPYALGICVAAACVWLLVRWLDSAKWLDGLAFVLCASLLWPVHLLYWPFFLVLAFYTVWRLLRRTTDATIPQAATVFAVIGLLVVPVALRALQLMRQASAHVIQPLPSLHHVEWSLRWKLVVLSAAISWMAARVLRWKRETRRLPQGTIALVVAWWLTPPFCLLAYSYITGNSVFLPRYFSLFLPGLVLTAACAASPFLNAAHWRTAAILVGAGALALLGQWNSPWPPHEHSDWRDAMALVNRQAAPQAALPVICTSPFIEAQPPNWRPDYPLPGFLYAHLSVYRPSGHILLFPFERSGISERYAASLLPRTLTAPGKFIIYGGAGNVRDWRDWFAQRPELTGWTNRLITFGDVYVVIFTSPSAA
ncbi:MAG TPA: glycosyltransferase family 39 protein [Candidatus Sulfopaludibacter sp.]|nr:glycosyltransferase family 39 protein [Candidatus Sulfopaludibacter sp.]